VDPALDSRNQEQSWSLGIDLPSLKMAGQGVTMNIKYFLVVCEGYFPYGFGLSLIPAISTETQTIEEAKKFVKENIKTTASI
jgi:hypothetical protein